MSDEIIVLSEDAVVDFREPAVQESLRIVKANRGLIPPDCSLCVPVDFDRAAWRRGAFWVLFRFVAGTAGLAGGIATAALARAAWHPAELTVVGIAAAVVGLSLLLSQSFFQARFMRAQIGDRYENLAAMAHEGKMLNVSIEDAATFHRLKIMPDDCGPLALEPPGGRLVIEGVQCRYFIRGEDIVNVQEILGGHVVAPAITYLVGNARLSLSVQCVGIVNELRQQSPFGKRDPVLVMVRQLLETDLASDASPSALPPG